MNNFHGKTLAAKASSAKMAKNNRDRKPRLTGFYLNASMDRASSGQDVPVQQRKVSVLNREDILPDPEQPVKRRMTCYIEPLSIHGKTDDVYVKYGHHQTLIQDHKSMKKQPRYRPAYFLTLSLSVYKFHTFTFQN